MGIFQKSQEKCEFQLYFFESDLKLNEFHLEIGILYSGNTLIWLYARPQNTVPHWLHIHSQTRKFLYVYNFFKTRFYFRYISSQIVIFITRHKRRGDDRRDTSGCWLDISYCGGGCRAMQDNIDGHRVWCGPFEDHSSCMRSATIFVSLFLLLLLCLFWGNIVATFIRIIIMT